CAPDGRSPANRPFSRLWWARGWFGGFRQISALAGRRWEGLNTFPGWGIRRGGAAGIFDFHRQHDGCGKAAGNYPDSACHLPVSEPVESWLVEPGGRLLCPVGLSSWLALALWNPRWTGAGF